MKRHTILYGALLILFLLPFFLVEINVEFIQFGLPLKDFFTLWVTGFGVVVLIINVVINSNRLTNQGKQLGLQEKSERITRFSNAIELLGNNHESARTGAAISLTKLAVDYPNEFKDEVFNILCAHVRTTTSNVGYQSLHEKKPSNEIQTILKLLFCKSNKNGFIFEEFDADLTECYLKGYRFSHANLSGVISENGTFDDVEFDHVNLKKAQFTGCSFLSSYFEDCDFENSKLYKCVFDDAKFNRVDFNYSIIRKSFFINGSFLENLSFVGTHIYGTTFLGIDLCDSSFWGSLISICHFSFSKLEDVSFQGNLMTSVSFSGSDIYSSCFSGSCCSKLSFLGCKIKDVKLLSLFGLNEIEFELIKKFKKQKWFVLEQNKGKYGCFSTGFQFGFLTRKRVEDELKVFKYQPKEFTYLQNEKLKYLIDTSFDEQISSKLEDFELGVLSEEKAEEIIKQIKFVQNSSIKIDSSES